MLEKKLDELDDQINTLRLQQEVLEEEHKRIQRNFMGFENEFYELRQGYQYLYSQNTSSSLEVYYLDSIQEVDFQTRFLGEKYKSQEELAKKKLVLNEEKVERLLDSRRRLLIAIKEDKEKGENNGN